MAGATKTRDERILIGASWYPETWPEDEWPKDVRRMREIGFNVVRMFEFAWHRFEPAENEFDFGWASRVMDLCHEAGIAVMAGTPTAAPPAWLTSKYPEVLKTGPDGRRATHGRRRHYSVCSVTYRDFCARMVSKMVEALGDHPALHSWQVDNEMGGADFGEETAGRFHLWLKERYGTIDELNRAWGLEFWSQAYGSFDQIPLPTASVGAREVQERHHPSLVIAAARFNTEAWSSFIGRQCEVIRAGSDKPVTTNMTSGLGMNWFRHNRALDRVGFSMYRDVAHYHWNLQNFDRMRAEKPAPYWLLETAPSWSAGGRIWNIHRDAKGVRAMSWMSTIMGGSMTLFWQWREHRAGQEMLHGTLVTATGKWRPNRDAMKRLASEYAEHGRWLIDHPPAKADAAIVLSSEAAWAFSIDPTDEDMEYATRWRDDFYLPLERRHIWRDVVHESADLSHYKIIVMPLMPMVAAETRARLRDWVREGGCLLLGPMTGFRTAEFTAFTDREFGGLEELMGAGSSVRFPAGWIEERFTVEFADGMSTRTRAWCEGFETTTGEALAHYRGEYGDGHVAIVRNRFGKGTVITLGCLVSEEVYVKLVTELLEARGVKPVASGSPGVVVVPRANADGTIAGYGLVNITEEPQKVTLPVAGTDMLTGERAGPEIALDPLGVMLVEIER